MTLVLFLSVMVMAQSQTMYHNDYWPGWSPDGTRLVFTSSRSEIPFDSRKDELYMVELKTGRETQITYNEFSDNTPHWSSDGSLISFISNREGQPDVYVMQPDGTNIRQVTRGGQAFNGSTNAISVKRSEIYFQSRKSGKINIYRVSMDGKNLDELFNSSGQYDNHSFQLSRDEDEMIYASNRSGSDRLYVYDFASGREEEIPVDPTYQPYYPSISSDGRWVSFISFKDELGGDIYRADRDGKNVKRLTTAADWDYDPAISPDNKLIAFNSRRDGKRGIYLMNADGSNQRKITSQIHGKELTQLIKAKGIDFGLKYYERHREKWGNEIYFSGLSMHNLALEQFQAGKKAEAIQLLRLSLDDPLGGWQVLNLKSLIKIDSSEATWQLLETMREKVVNKIGYDLLAEQYVAAAIKVFATNTKVHPQSATCWDSLGDGYMSDGQNLNARKSFEMALSLSPPESLKTTILVKLKKLSQSNQ